MNFNSIDFFRNINYKSEIDEIENHFMQRLGFVNEDCVYADSFAFNLLMPRKEFKKEYRNNKSLCYLSKKFGVEEEKIIRRFKQLGLETSLL